ncbi:MAG: metallophosphoesterase [Oscillospiraceae bacterium]|nr:metallophosphoesterase [Oscillospiraceae bacterium]
MSFFKRIGAAFNSRAGSFVFYALAVAAFFLLRSASWAFGWIPNYYPLGEAFVPTVFVLIILCGLTSLVYLVMPQRIREIKALGIAHVVSCVLAGALFVWTVFLAFALDHGLSGLVRNWPNVIPFLAYFALLASIPFVLLFFINMKKRTQVIISIVVAMAVAIGLAVPYITRAAASFDFSSYPLVLDIGDGYYSVVFATNSNSVGYLIIGGEVLPNDHAGRMHVGRVHNFQVPRDALDGSSYQVRAREVPALSSSYTNFGATIESPVFTFRGSDHDELNIAVASDWHNQPEKLVQAMAHMPPPDLFVMLGDYSSGYHSENDFIYNIIWAGAQVTGSEVPAIFVRGNHEMSGVYAAQIFPQLGLRSFYYQVQRGNFLFTVTDSADDWPINRTNTAEFEAGTIASTSPDYLDQQLAWLADLEVPDETLLHFSLVHIPNFDQEREQTQQQFFEQLQRLGVDMQFSAHWHGLASRFFEPYEEHSRFIVPLPLFFAGGPTDGYGGEVMASMVQANADGTVHLLGYDSTGRQLQDKTIALR